MPCRNLKNGLFFFGFFWTLPLHRGSRSTGSFPVLCYDGSFPTLASFVSSWQTTPRGDCGGAPHAHICHSIPRHTCATRGTTRDPSAPPPRSSLPPRPSSHLLCADGAPGGQHGVSSLPHLLSRRLPPSRDAGAEPSATSRLQQEHIQRTAKGQVLPALLLPARPGAPHLSCSWIEPLETSPGASSGPGPPRPLGDSTCCRRHSVGTASALGEEDQRGKRAKDS